MTETGRRTLDFPKSLGKKDPAPSSRGSGEGPPRDQYGTPQLRFDKSIRPQEEAERKRREFEQDVRDRAFRTHMAIVEREGSVDLTRWGSFDKYVRVDDAGKIFYEPSKGPAVELFPTTDGLLAPKGGWK